MKKYLFGSFAVVLAISFSAFTAPSHKFATTFFKYVGTSAAGYNVAANWQVSSSPFTSCGSTVNACTVESTTLTTAQQIADYADANNPQVNNGTIYHIDSKRAAF